MHRPSAEEFLLTLLETLDELPPDMAARFADLLKNEHVDRAAPVHLQRAEADVSIEPGDEDHPPAVGGPGWSSVGDDAVRGQPGERAAAQLIGPKVLTGADLNDESIARRRPPGKKKVGGLNRQDAFPSLAVH